MQIVIYVNLFSELSFNEITPLPRTRQRSFARNIINHNSLSCSETKIYVGKTFVLVCNSRNASGKGKSSLRTAFYEKQTIKQNMCLDKAKAKGKGHAETSREMLSAGKPVFI